MELTIQRVTMSRRPEVDYDKLVFGTVFSDHMFEAEFLDGEWRNPTIRPYGPLSFDPSLSALHYGQSVFEGMKAYYKDEQTVHLFRPEDHWKRLVDSCERMSVPPPTWEMFIQALETLLSMDHEWVPTRFGHSLYLRPFIFASDEAIVARSSNRYHFLIITSPVGPYYPSGVKPVRLTTNPEYARAVRGGTGFAKAAGNYAASFKPAKKAQQEGYTQVLWLDAIEQRYVEEVGTMNIFFKFKDRLVTPQLQGTVLPGVTRRSVIQLAKDSGIPVEERKVSIDEVFEAHKSGELEEAFGAGTAAVIAPVGLIHHAGANIRFDEENSGPFAQSMYAKITSIQYGSSEDPYGWIHPVNVDELVAR